MYIYIIVFLFRLIFWLILLLIASQYNIGKIYGGYVDF